MSETNEHQDQSVAANDLKPLNWQRGNVAMSATHFYMTYNDIKEGVSVHWHNKVTGESDKRHGFEDHEDAHEWIINTHQAQKSKEYQANSDASGYKVGQRWAHKITKKVILEVLEIGSLIIYTKAYSENNHANTSGVIKDDIHEFQSFIKTDYCLMLDGETIADCLARHGVVK